MLLGTYETLKVERDGHIVQITLNRPDRLNAMNDRMFEEIPQALRPLVDDDTVRVVIFAAAGRELFLRLVDRADVLIENFAPGTMTGLGLGPERLLERNPRLIYAMSTGYGSGGDYSRYPAMDLTIQAMTGTMATTGTPESGPLKTGPAGADFLSGIHLFAAVLLALLRRTATGRGQHLEVAMADAVIPSLASSIAYYLALGTEPPRTGNRHSGLAYAPYNVYPARDGHLAIFCVRDEHWRALAGVIGAPDLATDVRFDSIAARVAHIDEVDAVVTAWTSGLTRAGAFARLMEVRVPSAPVLTLSEVLTDPHYRQRGAVVRLDHPTAGPLLVPGSPLHLSDAPPLSPTPAPELGQHTDRVLSEILGLGPEELRSLHAAGVLGPTAAP